MESSRPGSAGVLTLSAMFLALLTGVAPGAQQRLNDPLPRAYGWFRDFQVSPDGTRVVYAAEQDLYEEVYHRYELYSVPLDGSAGSVKLSGTHSSWNWKLGSFRFTPDGGRVVFVMDYTGGLMSVPSDGSSGPISIAGIGCESCDDSYFECRITPDGARVLYRDNVFFEPPPPYPVYHHPLYSVPVDGSQMPVLLSAPDARFVSQFVASPDGTHVAFVADGYLYGRPIDASAPAIRLDPGLQFVEPGLEVAPDRTVVFRAHSLDGVVGLYAVPVDGNTTPVRISGSRTTRGNVVSFEVEADGKHVLYRADAIQDGRIELFRVRLDGSGPALRLNHRLSSGGNVTDYEISPDGTHVVYQAHENGVVQIFSVRTDGSRPALRLNADLVVGGNASSFLITPDGRWVVYLADQRIDGLNELFSVPIDLGDRPRLRQVGAPRVRNLNAELAAGSSGISWYAFARDAGRVLYRADVDAVGQGVFAVPLRGGSSIRILAPPVPEGFCAASAPAAAVLPGSRAAFVLQPDLGADRALVSVPLDGGTPMLRLNPPLARGPTVGRILAQDSSPDGEWTVYVADQEFDEVYELYSVPTAGGVSPVKLNGPLPFQGDVGVDGYIVEEGTFAITSDGTRVVYMADQEVDHEVELYVAPIDGLSPALRLGSGAGVQAGFALDGASARVVFLQRDTQGTVRVSSQRLDGSEAPLDLTGTLVAGGNVEAFALAPDGTRVIFRADAELDQRLELYSVPADGSAPRVRLSSDLASNRDVSAFAITPDSSRVLFLADARVDQRFELYSAPLAGGQALELDPDLVGSGNVLGFVVSSDGAWAVFVATTGVQQKLHAVPCDASAPPHRLDGPLVAGGNVLSQAGTFLVSPDSRRVAYLADQDTDGKLELYSGPIDGSSAARRLNDPLGGLVHALDDRGRGALRITPDSRRVLFLANAHSSGSPNPVDLFVVGIAGVRPPLRLTPPAGSLVVSFELDPFGLYALYRDKYQSELFYVATDASRPARRVDLDPGPCSGVTRAGFTADDRFALYLDEGECDVVELYSFPLPRHLRGSDPPAAF